MRPDYRGRRLQSALLARFKLDAVQLGPDLLCSQASFGSTSHRNIERADFGSCIRRLSGQDRNVLLYNSTILHTDFEAETRGILRDPLTVIDDHANDHSDTVPMRGDAGNRRFATK